MNRVLYFGETLDAYDVPVLNEREVRASAGILFLFAMIAFMIAWLTGNFYYTRVFVVAFLIDFAIRIFVNPKYAPTMIAGRFFVRHQSEEYVGAPQKRFAWSIGLLLAVTMFFLIVVNNVIGPINLFICLTCLVLLFFESAFGICIACKVYNLAFKEKAKLCPGNVCEVTGPRPGTTITAVQVGIGILFLVAIAAAGRLISRESPAGFGIARGEPEAGSLQPGAAAGDCTVPDWAVAIGHAEMWKLHNNCKTGTVLPANAGVVGTAKQSTVEIIAMAHPPVQSALKPLRDWIAANGTALNVVEIDAESADGERRLAALGLKGHIPIVILIDGKYRFARSDGSVTDFINFPAAAGFPTSLNGTWTTSDVETVLASRLKESAPSLPSNKVPAP
jgi:hypothetical protein